MHRQRGMTLIEVMIVLAIVLILATLAYPSYAGYVTKSRRIEGQVALLETMQQQERYFMRNNTYAAFSASTVEAGEGGTPQFRPWSSASAQRSAYELEGRACAGQAVADCIEVRATPGTAQVDSRFRDPDCGTLTLDSVGRRGASGPSAATCWP